MVAPHSLSALYPTTFVLVIIQVISLQISVEGGNGSTVGWMLRETEVFTV